MPIISHRLRFIEKFLANFKPAFSKKQMSVFREFIYAMFDEYKRLSLAAILKQYKRQLPKAAVFLLGGPLGRRRAKRHKIKTATKSKNNKG